MGEYIADAMFWYGNMNHKKPYRSLVKRALIRKLKAVEKERLGLKVSEHTGVYVKDMRRRFSSKKSESKGRGLDFNLSFARYKCLMESECFYCGFGQAECIDRVDNLKGYSDGNSVPCCIACNSSKGNKDVLTFVNKNKDSLAKRWLLNIITT